MKNSIKENVEALLAIMEPIIGRALFCEAVANAFTDSDQVLFLVPEPAYVRNTITESSSYVPQLNQGIAELEAYRNEYQNEEEGLYDSEITLITVFRSRLVLTRDRLIHANVVLETVLESLEEEEMPI